MSEHTILLYLQNAQIAQSTELSEHGKQCVLATLMRAVLILIQGGPKKVSLINTAKVVIKILQGSVATQTMLRG